MRTLFVSLLMLCTSFSVFAQRVISDTMVDDSTRIVSTSHMICRTFTDRLVLAVGLTAFKCNDQVFYAIDAQITTLSPSTIPDNGRMLIKTNDGNVIELATTRSEVSTSSKWYGNTTVSRLGNTYYVNQPTISTSTASASYFISEEELLSTFNGVKKVRIEIEPTMYDKEFKKDLVGSTLKNEYNLLKTKLGSNKVSDESFKEGF